MERDRNLLFGVLAVQLKMVTPQKLVEAAGSWATNQERALGDILVEMGAITENDKGIIDGLISRQVEMHNGDAGEALKSFGGERAVHETFAASIVLKDDKVELVSFGGEQKEAEGVEKIEDDTNVTIEPPNKYTIKGEHGRGGIGRVLIAVDTHIGRDVAIKELLPHPSTGTPSTPDGEVDSPMRQTAAVTSRFLREARITGKLEHPGIVPVYELGKRSDGTLYYTMRLVRGQTLAEAIQEKSLSERLKFLPNYLDLCNTIAYAHSKGVIHRDIKPQNVMVGEFGETVLLDWGLGKVKGTKDVSAGDLEKELGLMKTETDGETVVGKPIGTPSYMSPEQADGKIDEIDERSDVWSLGAVLYEILKGKSPFTGVNALEIIGKVLKKAPEPIEGASKYIPNQKPFRVTLLYQSILFLVALGFWNFLIPFFDSGNNLFYWILGSLFFLISFYFVRRNLKLIWFNRLPDEKFNLISILGSILSKLSHFLTLPFLIYMPLVLLIISSEKIKIEGHIAYAIIAGICVFLLSKLPVKSGFDTFLKVLVFLSLLVTSANYLMKPFIQANFELLRGEGVLIILIGLGYASLATFFIIFSIKKRRWLKRNSSKQEDKKAFRLNTFFFRRLTKITCTFFYEIMLNFGVWGLVIVVILIVTDEMNPQTLAISTFISVFIALVIFVFGIMPGSYAYVKSKDSSIFKSSFFPKELVAVTLKCLSKEKSNRYQQAEILAKDIRNFQTGSLVSAYDYSVFVLLKRWVGKHKSILATSTAVFLILFMPFIIFLILAAVFTLPVPEKTIKGALDLMKQNAYTNAEGLRYGPDFNYGRLVREAEKIKQWHNRRDIPSISEEPVSETNRLLDPLAAHSKIAQGYTGNLAVSEADIFISDYSFELPYVGGQRHIVRCYINRARWLEHQGDIKGAADDYLAILNLAKHLTKHFSLISHMVSVACIGMVFEPLTEFLRNHGSKLSESDLIGIYDATYGHEQIIEALEFERFWNLLMYAKMSKEWPRTLDPGLYKYTDFEMKGVSWYEKILFVLLPKNYFKYLIYLKLRSSGFIKSPESKLQEKFRNNVLSSSRHAATSNRGALSSSVAPIYISGKIYERYEKAKLFAEKLSMNCFGGYPFAYFIYMMTGLNEIWNINPLFGEYISRAEDKGRKLDYIRSMVAIFLYHKKTGFFPMFFDELIPDHLENIPFNYRIKKPMMLTYLTDGKNTKPYIIYENLPLIEKDLLSVPAGVLPTLTLNINGIEFPMVYVPEGAFRMGSTPDKVKTNCDQSNENYIKHNHINEGPVHDVYLKGYYISRTEVTKELWASIMCSGEALTNPKKPIDNVSFDQIKVFIEKLNLYNKKWRPHVKGSKKSSKSNRKKRVRRIKSYEERLIKSPRSLSNMKFSLPTEARWERAARGWLESKAFPWGNQQSINKLIKLGNSGLLPVASLSQNGFGLYDMAGNVSEICSDDYNPDFYRKSPYISPKYHNKEIKNAPKVVRGGSWKDDLCDLRVSARRGIDLQKGEEGVGFRLVLVKR